MKTNLFEAINLLASEKEIDKEILLEALDAAIVSAYKRTSTLKQMFELRWMKKMKR